MNEEIKEYTMDDLEDIIREFSTRPQRKPEKEQVPEATVRMDALSGDTVRLDEPAAPKQEQQATRPLPDIDEDVRVYQPVKKKKPAPESVPEQPKSHQEPIAFPPKNRLQQLREKLEEDPGRHTDFSEKGLRRLRTGMVLQFALLLTAAVMALLAYRAEGAQRTAMVAVQVLILLLSALLGCRRLMDGVMVMLRRSFRLESLLAVSFAVCLLDGLVCLGTQHLPFGVVFALQMLMAQWSEYQKRQTQIGQRDTLRKAVDLTAVVKTDKYYKNQPAYQTVEGRPEDLPDRDREESGPERALRYYALAAAALGGVLALTAAVLHGVAAGLRVYAAALLAAVPASTFITVRRPEAILEKRMHKLGTVLCGWKGLQNIEKHGYYPLQHGDLFPAHHVKLNGVRFYGERNVNTVVSYVSALMAADGGALAKPFEQLRASRNARVCRVEELTSYPDGVGGQIDGLSIIAGTAEFMENMGVSLPDGARLPHAVYTAVNQSLCAVFAVSFTRSKSSASGLQSLCLSHHVRPILVDCDFMMTGPFLEQKLGVDIRRMQFPDCMTRMKLARKQADANAPVIALATRGGLAQRVYAVTGGAALRSAWRVGAAVHILGGSIGFLAVAVLGLTGSLFLLTPYNLLLYGFVWMVPGLLVAEWTRSV